MKGKHHILLLSGSFEARRMAQALNAQGVSYEAWLSEAPRGTAPMPQVPLLRRFETSEAMQAAMAAGGFSHVIDASHTFDRTVTQQGAQAADALDVPYLRLERAAWGKVNSAADVPAANAMIPKGARVFCATGWDSLPDYAPFAGEMLMLRQTRRHDRPAPYPFVQLVFGDPPFDVAAETELFLALNVDLLICRNLGGAASRPKVDAATALGIKTILIDRPPAPTGLRTVSDIIEAIAWLG